MLRAISFFFAVSLCSCSVLAQVVSTRPGSEPEIITLQTSPAPTVQGQVPPRENVQKAGTAVLRGQVLAADSGLPLRKAQVRAFAGDMRASRLVSTDAQGRYEFRDLPAGRYSISASRTSYIGLSFGQTRPTDPAEQLEILDGQTVEKADFRLPRGGVITGRILDEFGEPVADAQVAPMRYQYQAGRRRLVQNGRVSTTNDIGEFRTFGLPPGDYYLSATLRSGIVMGISDDRTGYAPTYYPGTASLAEAQRVTLGSGQTVSDLNMVLVPARTARVSGTAVDSQGRFMVGRIVNAVHDIGIGSMGGGSAMVMPNGTFSLSGLVPGEYTLQVQSPGSVADNTEFAWTTVTVAGEDITGILLRGAVPSRATGHLVIDPAAAASLPLSSLRVVATPADPDRLMMAVGSAGNVGTVKDDLTFEFKVRPGRSFIRLASPVSAWSLKAVRLNGADVTDTAVDFKPNEEVGGIEVELTNRPTDVSGLVTGGSGPVEQCWVVVFSQNRERWGLASRFLRTATSDRDGHFHMQALPPGDYYIVAVGSMEQGQSSDPEFLEQVQSKASQFSLMEGETKVLNLRLSSGP